MNAHSSPLREPQKTFSEQQTFGADITDEEYAEATLRRMADHLFASVRGDNRTIRTLTVRVRYNDMGEDMVSESLNEPTDLETDVYSRLHTMLRRAWKRRVSLRLGLVEALQRLRRPVSERIAAGGFDSTSGSAAEAGGHRG